MRAEQRGRVTPVRLAAKLTVGGGESVTEPKPTMAKPFVISKWVVSEAYETVKANQGAARVDGQSIAELERDLKGNLYKLWNRG